MSLVFQAFDICAPSGIEAAIENVEALQRELVDHCSDAGQGLLQPLPDENMKQCAQELGASSKVVSASIAQLMSAAAQVSAAVAVDDHASTTILGDP